jgi:uncharacterized protein YxeA
MKRLTCMIFAVLLLAACESAFTTDSVVGNWTLKYQEDRSDKKQKDCPAQMELGDNKKATIHEKNGEKKEMEYYVQLDDTEKQLFLFPDLKEEKGSFYYLQEDFIKLEFWDRGVVCEYGKMN